MLISAFFLSQLYESLFVLSILPPLVPCDPLCHADVFVSHMAESHLWRRLNQQCDSGCGEKWKEVSKSDSSSRKKWCDSFPLNVQLLRGKKTANQSQTSCLIVGKSKDHQRESVDGFSCPYRSQHAPQGTTGNGNGNKKNMVSIYLVRKGFKHRLKDQVRTRIRIMVKCLAQGSFSSGPSAQRCSQSAQCTKQSVHPETIKFYLKFNSFPPQTTLRQLLPMSYNIIWFTGSGITTSQSFLKLAFFFLKMHVKCSAL